MRIVIALGDNAFRYPGQRLDATAKRSNAVRVATAVAPLAHEHDLVLTHNAGPRLDMAGAPAGSPPEPVDLLLAQAGGGIASILTCVLRDALPGRPVAGLVTHTRVRADDPAFAWPSRRVGPAWPRGTAQALAARYGWSVAEDQDGWRRVVPSPRPECVLEAGTVGTLLDAGTIVVCSGGGGVPVVGEHTGASRAVEAVVDKDLCAAVLAEELKADFLLILTDVPNLYASYGTPRQRPVLDATPAELRRGGYPPDSVGPKAEAAARFVERTGGLAAIGALDAAYDIVHGGSGTLVRPELPAT